MIFDMQTKKFTGLIDFGEFHYAEPARDMHYYCGNGAKDLLYGYGDNGDMCLRERQKFQSIINLIHNVGKDIEDGIFTDKSIAKLKGELL